MFRHSPSRNQRSKGFRLKHALQICVLVAVCFWLIYQVKHSHDKRKQFDENNTKNLLNVSDNSVVVKLGRKDLIPQEKVANKDFESHDGEVEEDDNEEGNIEQDKHEDESREEVKHEEDTEEEEESEEDNKHEETTEKEDEHEEETGEKDKLEQLRAEDKNEEEDQEEDIKAEENDEGRGDNDGEVEHEQEQDNEKADKNVDREKEFIDEEKEKEDPIEKVTEEKDDEVKDTRIKNNPSLEVHVHDEGSWNTREAREEQYKGDDASSAVTHDAPSTSTENENGSTVNQLSILEDANKGNSTEDGKNTTVVNFLEVATPGNGTSTSDEEQKPVVFDSVSLSNSSLASITNLESNDQQGSNNNTDINGSSVKNETEIIISDPSHAHNATEGDRTTTDGFNVQTIALNQITDFTVTKNNTQVNSNSSNSNATRTMEENSEESTNSSVKSEVDDTKNVEESNVSAESKDDSDSSVLDETTNEEKNNNLDNTKETDGTYEKSDSSTTEETGEVQYDSTDTSDPSVPVEDKESRIDLDTFPEIRTEGTRTNSEEVAED